MAAEMFFFLLDVHCNGKGDVPNCIYVMIFICNANSFKSWSLISTIYGRDNLMHVDKRDGSFDFCFMYIIDRLRKWLRDFGAYH